MNCYLGASKASMAKSSRREAARILQPAVTKLVAAASDIITDPGPDK